MSLPDHLFVGNHGELYDCRVQNWHKLRPLRTAYRFHFSTIKTCSELKATLRLGRFTSIRCYPLYFVTSDGAAISFGAVRANLASVLHSIKTRCDDGWRVVACQVNWEDAYLTCDHSGERIESAYTEAND